MESRRTSVLVCSTLGSVASAEDILNVCVSKNLVERSKKQILVACSCSKKTRIEYATGFLFLEKKSWRRGKKKEGEQKQNATSFSTKALRATFADGLTEKVGSIADYLETTKKRGVLFSSSLGSA